MHQRIDDQGNEVGNTNTTTVVDHRVRKDSFKRPKKGMRNPIQETLKPTFVVSSGQIEDDLQANQPIAHTKEIIYNLTYTDEN